MRTKLFRAYAEAWAFCRKVCGEIVVVEHGWLVCY